MVATLVCFGCRHPRIYPRDAHVTQDGPQLIENTNLVSPPVLCFPIYQCTKGVCVKGFIPGAQIDIFIQGNPTSIGGGVSYMTWGQPFDVTTTFTAGQIVFATQTYQGVRSPPSNLVPVTNYRDDFPDGVPQPRITSVPLLQCGRAIAFADVIRGAWVKVFAENPAGGGFGAPVLIGSTENAQPELGYVFVNPEFALGGRITIQSGICTETSPLSRPEIVQPAPVGRPPSPRLDPVYEGTHIVTLWGHNGAPDPLLNGASLTVYDNPPPGGTVVGGQPTPGGGQQVFVDPAAPSPAAGKHYSGTQKLCVVSDPGPSVPVTPCRNVPAPIIRKPFPGDTQIEVIQYVPGARITVFVSSTEVGDGGPPIVNMIDGAGNPRPLNNGEAVTVIQRLGDCQSRWRYVITVDSTVGGTEVPTSGDWPMFRNATLRDGQQRHISALTDPYAVKKLQVKWSWPPGNAFNGSPIFGFRASAVVRNGVVYIGNGNGYLYALDENTGNFLWQYPPVGSPALRSQFESNPSSYGISSSAALATIDRNDFVIFAAPDQRVGARLGSGRLFTLRADTGAEFWLSPEIAVLNGLSAGSAAELHEQIGYSSPLVLNNRVYVGIADHGDNPIQNGRAAAVDLFSGAIELGFTYHSTSSRGGGVWSSMAGGFGTNVFITTGNARAGNPGGPPMVNHSLSMLRLDGNSGAVGWQIQPVPFEMDDDPDWASGVTLIASSCGNLAVSTMKDGWSYAARAQSGVLLWQFPPTHYPFTPGDGTNGRHNDTRYLIPGAAWNDVFITTTGGEIVPSDVSPGYNRIHALNVCASPRDRVRWVVDIPDTDHGSSYQLGPPTVTRGIVFVGTAQGHLIALADPSVWPASGCNCSNPDVPVADCVANGYILVPKPAILANVDLNTSGNRILTEPVIANGRVFIASGGYWSKDPAKIYMLEPAP
jgi:outer membrane protein assembly factor BamB